MFGDELFDSSFAYPFRSSNRQHPVMADSNRDPTIRPGGEQRVLNRSYFTGAFHFARVASMRIMNLSLRQNLAYQKLPYEGSSAEAAYRTLIAFLDQAPIGSEGILLLSSEMDVLFLGTTDPWMRERWKKSPRRRSSIRYTAILFSNRDATTSFSSPCFLRLKSSQWRNSS